ncbi:MAG: DUF192 domain-containing protein [Myxococcales bacterium]
MNHLLRVLVPLCLTLLACTNDAASKPREAPREQKPSASEVPMFPQRGKVTLRTRTGKELVLDVEIVSNDEDRARGMMFRKSLPAMAGMIFVFPEEEVHSFWMKNTLIPLDMIFADRDGRIVGVVENAQPQTLNPRMVDGKSKFVLEVNGGFAARHGIAAGDTLELTGMYDLR